MSIKGYVDYKRREFCNDVKCPIQIDLNAQKEGSAEYEKIRGFVKQIVNIPHINSIIG